MVLGRVVDSALEVTVAGSFSKIGYVVRRRTDHWTDAPQLDGKAYVVTGASSGIGREIAVGLARLGANVWLVGRDERRTQEAASAAQAVASKTAVIEAVLLDVTDPAAVLGFVDTFSRKGRLLDGLVHNA